MFALQINKLCPIPEPLTDITKHTILVREAWEALQATEKTKLPKFVVEK
jgi:hypothetical protein